MVKRVLMAAPDGCNFLNICHEPLGNTILHIAAGKGDVAMCKLLLNFGADPNIRNHSGKVPLHVAWSSFLESPTFEKQVRRVQAETCIEFLLQYGADPNAFAPYRYLHYGRPSSLPPAELSASNAGGGLFNNCSNPFFRSSTLGGGPLILAPGVMPIPELRSEAADVRGMPRCKAELRRAVAVPEAILR